MDPGQAGLAILLSHGRGVPQAAAGKNHIVPHLQRLLRPAILALALLVAGCLQLAPLAVPPGSVDRAGPAGGRPAPGRTAVATLQVLVRWPDGPGRDARGFHAQLIPDSTARIAFAVKQGAATAGTAMLLRQAGEATASANTEVPVASGLTLEATAYPLSGGPLEQGGAIAVGSAAGLSTLGVTTLQVGLTMTSLYAPAITSMSVAAGREGDTVTLAGSNLAAGWAAPPAVSFGGRPAAEPTVGPDGSLTVVVPPAATVGNVTVAVDGVESVSTAMFWVVEELAIAVDTPPIAGQTVPEGTVPGGGTLDFAAAATFSVEAGRPLAEYGAPPAVEWHADLASGSIGAIGSPSVGDTTLASAARLQAPAGPATGSVSVRLGAATATVPVSVVGDEIAQSPALAAYFSAAYALTNAENEAATAANPDNPERRLAALIASAVSTVDAAIYELDESGIVAALGEARGRGLTVRIVTDADSYYSSPGVPAPDFQHLLDAGIPVVADTRTALMHDKFVVVDDQTVWTGSFNPTVSAARRQNNNAFLAVSAALASNFETEFREMFVDRRFGSTSPAGVPQPVVSVGGATIATLFSPEDDVGDRIVAEIAQAQSSLKFMLFSFTHDAIGDAIRARAAAGVAVQGIVEKTGSNGTGGEFPRFLTAGLDVRVDGNPSFMHHKVLILDDATVITGSFNFSASADSSNDENVVIVRDAPDIAAAYVAEFARVRQAAIQAGN